MHLLLAYLGMFGLSKVNAVQNYLSWVHAIQNMIVTADMDAGSSQIPLSQRIAWKNITSQISKGSHGIKTGFQIRLKKLFCGMDSSANLEWQIDSTLI
jgi:hypothetical protein